MLTSAKEKVMSSKSKKGANNNPFDEIVNKKYQKEAKKVRKQQLSSLLNVLESGVS
jgi:hypothetical protein